MCKSAKSAETRAVDLSSDDGIFLAMSISEIYTGKKGKDQLPMVVKCDSQSLIDSLNSTKQVEEKLMRNIVQHLKDLITRKQILRVDWVDTNNCHADILTKKGARGCDKVLTILKTGRNMYTTKH